MDDFEDVRPFQSVVRNAAAESILPEDPAGAAEIDAEWSLAALEDAYQRALESADAVTAQVEELAAPALLDASQVAADIATPPLRSAQSVAAPEPAGTQVAPEQVLEALLFVGGEPLTGRRLAELLGGGGMYARVEEFVVQLNARYADESRPFHVQLGEGGYRLALRPEFEAIRNRVYGLGPRDVRLSQDALEMLALVAYQQPISRSGIEATGKQNAAALIRQLLRLEVISLERGQGGKDDVSFRTTVRFLQLFALDRLEDLPHPEDLMLR